MNISFLRPRLWRVAARCLLHAAFLVCLISSAIAREYLVYFGTYTGAKSKGIYVSRFDTKSGELSKAELAAETPSPSFLAVHPGNRYLYAVNEVGKFEGKPAGSVSSFSLDAKSGKLSLINVQSSRGGAPCHIIVDKSGRNVLVANYSGGSVAVLPVLKTGALEPASAFVQHVGSSMNKSRQEAPHAHGIYLDGRNRFAYVPDLGLDQYLIYRFDSGKGTLTPAAPPFASVVSGSGPRHFALHPSGRFAYGINEMVCTVTAFSCDPKTGALTTLETLSTLPPGEAFKGSFSTAELFCHPSGRFLYGSNRGHDTIAVYAIDQKLGKLSYVENASTKGKTPRSFGIDPTGRWLLAANQSSDTVFVFAIDANTGRLTATGQSIEVGSPVSVSFVPAK
ncbi:MAG: lactonase family protein [Verrucomicrobia bacterium]|nr:lactonase family protein [Verrucomicrobiota bacterium]